MFPYSEAGWQFYLLLNGNAKDDIALALPADYILATGRRNKRPGTIRNLRPGEYSELDGPKIGPNGGGNKGNGGEDKGNEDSGVRINVTGPIRVAGGSKSITLKAIGNKIVQVSHLSRQ